MDAILLIALLIALGGWGYYAYRQNRRERNLTQQHTNYVVGVERFWTDKDDALESARTQAGKHFSKENTALNKRDWALKLAQAQLELAQSEHEAGVSLLNDVEAIVSR